MRILICFFLLFISSKSFSQYNDSVFMIAYGGNSYEEAIFVKQLSNDDYFMIGNTSSIGNGNNDIFLIRTNKYGVKTFSKTIGSNFVETGNSAVYAGNGEFIIIATTNRINNTYNPLIIKVDSSGNILWEKVLEFKNWTLPHAILKKDNKIFISGNTSSNDEKYSNIFITAMSNNGDSLWTKILEASNNQSANSIFEIERNAIGIVGYDENNSPNDKDILLIKCDTEGNLLWNKSIKISPQNDIGNDAIVLKDGRIAIVGQTAQDSTNINNDEMTLFTNMNGDFLYQNIDSQPGNGISVKIKCTYSSYLADSVLSIIGTSSTWGAGKQDFRLLITDINGFYKVGPSFGSIENEIPVSFDYTNDGGYIIIGNTNSFYNKLSKIFLVKTNKSFRTTTVSSFVYTTTEDQSITERNIFYPNPFFNQISFETRKQIKTIEVYDILGNLVLRKDYENTPLITSSLKSGYYVIKLIHNDSITVLKGMKD